MADTLRIVSWESSGLAQRFALFCGPSELTCIEALHDKAICVYEDGAFSPRRVGYALSYDTGNTWTTGALSDTEVAADAPAVAAYRAGFAAVFRHNSPTPELRFCHCTDSGPWDPPVSIADNEPSSGRPVIMLLADYPVWHYQVYGVGYLSDTSPVVRGAYFDGGVAYGVAEQRRPQVAGTTPATVVRSVLVLPRDMTETSDVSDRVPRPSLLDAAGRKVLDLKSGANDVSGLAPGVYFVREAQAQAQAQAVTKVVVTR